MVSGTREPSAVVLPSSSRALTVSDTEPMRDARDHKMTACLLFKFLYSTLLVIFSASVIVSLILQRETKVSQDVNAAAALGVIIVALSWLFMVEGGQASLVGLPPVEQVLYQHSHPIAYQICSLAHRGNNLDRYIIGRQFMVLLIVFTMNQCGAALKDATVFDDVLPDWFLDFILGAGIAMILVTACCGQLMSQVNASHCMLDFM